MLRAGALGDVLLGLPALRGLRRAYPEAEITFVAPLPQGGVARWEPVADRVVGFDEPGLGPLIGGTAADWPALLPVPELLVVWLRDHAAVRAAAGRLHVARSVGCAPLEATLTGTHVADWLTRSLEPVGVRVGPDLGTLMPPGGARARDRSHVVVHPGSGSARKNWPLWHEVISALRPRRVTVISGPADERAVGALLSGWPDGVAAPAVLDGASLEHLAHVLAGAALYLGNDSGVSHLSAAVGTPTVVAFGPTDPRVWAPPYPNAVALGGAPVTGGVFAETAMWPTVDEVVQSARPLWDQAA